MSFEDAAKLAGFTVSQDQYKGKMVLTNDIGEAESLQNVLRIKGIPFKVVKASGGKFKIFQETK